MNAIVERLIELVAAGKAVRIVIPNTSKPNIIHFGMDGGERSMLDLSQFDADERGRQWKEFQDLQTVMARLVSVPDG